MSDSPFDLYQPCISIDSVIFGFHDNSLSILLLKLKNVDVWTLPGGFVKKDENLDAAASRVLRERTGLNSIFLHQFKAFGNTERVPDGHANWVVDNKILSPEWLDWIKMRFVTIGYYALVEYSKVEKPKPDHSSESCSWFPITELPNLMIDHLDILTHAYEELKRNLNQQPIGLNLLPDKFTMPELRTLYETILGKPLDRRNFQRKMLNFDILIKTNERRKGGSHKAPILYRFDHEKYERALQSGLNSSW